VQALPSLQSAGTQPAGSDVLVVDGVPVVVLVVLPP
jgi:hypothetical protein